MKIFDHICVLIENHKLWLVQTALEVAVVLRNSMAEKQGKNILKNIIYKEIQQSCIFDTCRKMSKKIHIYKA